MSQTECLIFKSSEHSTDLSVSHPA